MWWNSKHDWSLRILLDFFLERHGTELTVHAQAPLPQRMITAEGQAVPKYYFDVRTNDHIQVDHDGTDLPNDREAHRAAIKAIAKLAAEEIPRDGPLQLTIGVADEDHHLLHRVRVTFEPGK